MSASLFVLFDHPDAVASAADLALVEERVTVLEGLERALVLTPLAASAEHPFKADGRGPALALQLDFASADALAASLDPGSRLASLAAADALPSLAGATVSHQPMTRRDFPVADPAVRLPPGGLPCTFLVQYPGRAEKLRAWLDHYDANHPPIMVRFPGIRAVSTFRPIEAWRSGLPWARSEAMQRNKVVFDSVAALEAALASPVMNEMRADGATFPPYSPRATHHPMDTRAVGPG